MKFLLIVLAVTALLRRLLPERRIEKNSSLRTIARSDARSFGQLLEQLKALFVPK